MFLVIGQTVGGYQPGFGRPAPARGPRVARPRRAASIVSRVSAGGHVATFRQLGRDCRAFELLLELRDLGLLFVGRFDAFRVLLRPLQFVRLYTVGEGRDDKVA